MAQLSAYDVVVVMNQCTGFADHTALGNNLADYEDGGGVVVAATFTWQSSNGPAGRWLSGGYSPYQTFTSDHFSDATLGTHDSASPLLQGVSSLFGHYRLNMALTPGATEIAKWSDGLTAVAFKGQAVGINAYIGDDAGSPSSTYWSGDFAKIIVNAGVVLGRHVLSVAKTGVGDGTVTSSPAGISCGGACSAAFNNGATVTLTATPSPGGSTFAGWSGAGCSGTGTCTVTMTGAAAVTAQFNPNLPPRPVIPAVVSGATESNSVFADSASPKLVTTARKHRPIGTTFKFTLDKPASIRLDFTQPGKGRKVNGKCVAQNKHNKRKHKCTRTLIRGTLNFSGHAGQNTVKFFGWLSKHRKLKPGKYTLAITATTPGVGSTSQKLTFTIVK